MSWRKKFDGILSQYGHDVYLQRRIVDRGTKNYSYREDNGFTAKLEKHTVRSRLANRSTSIPGIKDEMPEGLVQDVDKIFYFRYDVNPDKHDRIYEHEPTRRLIYVVDWAQPLRGPGGAVVYWAVGASLIEEDGNG